MLVVGAAVTVLALHSGAVAATHGPAG